MLNKAKTLKGYKLDSLDGEFGEVKEFYFDDRHWTIRYRVARPVGRQVLISPHALVAAIKAEEHVAVDLSKKQIEDSSSLSTDKPVSRQFEQSHFGYYGYPMYWGVPIPGERIPIRCVIGNNISIAGILGRGRETRGNGPIHRGKPSKIQINTDNHLLSRSH